MTTIDRSERRNLALRSRSAVWWRQALFLGITGIGLFLLLTPNTGRQRNTATQGSHVSQHVQPFSDAQRLTSSDAIDSQFIPGRSLPTSVPADVWPRDRQARSSKQPPEPTPRSWELDALVSKVKNMTEITEEGAADIERMLQELRKQGSAAVPAISNVLRQGDDVNFTKMSGGELLGYQTLRQALIDALRKIGGGEALAASLEQIQQTRDPIEIAMFARNLEEEAPGISQDKVIQAVSNTLQWAEQVSPKERLDVSPLFNLLRTYDGEKAVAVLKQFAPQWGEYTLITLASLPKGAGIPGLIALTSASGAAVENPVLPFQVLAQTAARYSEAGAALVDLARAGQIPDQAWSEIGDTLGGKQLQLSSKMFDGTPLAQTSTVGPSDESPLWENYYIEWLNIRYEQRIVSVNWSENQINQALTLIDQLRSVAFSPAAVAALQQARAALQRNS